jgi:Glycosyl transferases group 1
VYLVHDHEPEFFATSAEAVWAEQTYGLDLYPISASTWLQDIMRERYGREGSWFRFGVDHSVYKPRNIERRPDTVMFYARYYTPRRAVPLGLLALHELWQRRPDVRIVLFGSEEPPDTSFPYEFLGVVSPEVLARHYAEATVGICLSLTNYSLIPQEMMACGLPCVDLAGRSPEAVFGSDGPVELAKFDPVAIADAAEALLTDKERWARRSNAPLSWPRLGSSRRGRWRRACGELSRNARRRSGGARESGPLRGHDLGPIERRSAQIAPIPRLDRRYSQLLGGLHHNGQEGRESGIAGAKCAPAPQEFELVATGAQVEADWLGIVAVASAFVSEFSQPLAVHEHLDGPAERALEP